MELPAKAVGHAVRNAQPAVGKCHTSHARTNQHIVARHHVITVVIGALQIGKHVPDGSFGINGRKHVAVARCIGLHSVGQHVHAC